MTNKKSKKTGWKIALTIMVILGAAIQVSAQSFDDILCIKVGDYGGKWETLESGETVFVFSDGNYAKNAWIQDGNLLYYVDASGCLMKENYSHDGYYLGKNGTLDKSVKRLEKNVQPRDKQTYRCQDSDKTLVFQLSANTACMTYYGNNSNYSVIALGRGIFILHNVSDEFDHYHVVVLNNGQQLRVSAAGETEVFTLK